MEALPVVELVEWLAEWWLLDWLDAGAAEFPELRGPEEADAGGLVACWLPGPPTELLPSSTSPLSELLSSS